MKINKAATMTTLAVVAMMAMSGCVTIETEPKDDTAGQMPNATSTPTQAPSKKPTSEPTPRSTDESSESSKPVVDLGDPKYVHGNDFGSLIQPSPVTGPYFESWFIDGKNFTYTHKSCLGTTELEVTGTIEKGELVWDDGEDPWPGDETTETTPVKITDTELNPEPIIADASTTDIDAEKEEFADFCKTRGEDVADVFIG